MTSESNPLQVTTTQKSGQKENQAFCTQFTCCSLFPSVISLFLLLLLQQQQYNCQQYYDRNFIQTFLYIPSLVRDVILVKREENRDAFAE